MIDERLLLWVCVWVDPLLPTDCAVATRMVPRLSVFHLDWAMTSAIDESTHQIAVTVLGLARGIATVCTHVYCLYP
jgi:hypothetical protein